MEKIYIGYEHVNMWINKKWFDNLIILIILILYSIFYCILYLFILFYKFYTKNLFKNNQ